MPSDAEEQKRFEQDRAIEAFHEIEKRRYKTGRLLLILCGVAHILGALLSFSVFFNPLSLAVEVLLAVLLLCGVVWSRYALATYAVVDATILLFVVCGGYIRFDDPRESALFVVFVGIYVLYDAVTAALLYANKAIGFYLYERKNG